MSKPTLRCAIYTRKSSEEGLEQGFNSLDAQREACGAFILSQQHEGWKALPTLYDDGGYSGGNMDRPALQRLLADIDQKKVNVVVVYKVDRLTRSLADFAKIVEQFDAKGISFVSVTQQFNTTSSMGRLTLNVLLSFAQFEREVTGERIRDKIAASKQKGLWMGGTAPIGYAGFERTLIVVEEHAQIIRHIYQRYLDLGSIRLLESELRSTGHVAPGRVRSSGKQYGGVPFSRGNLQRILTNPVYIGKMSHFDKVFDGQHPAIVDQTLWAAVQTKISDNRQSHTQRPMVTSDSLLTGLIYDNAGLRLTPSHTQKKTQRYRYYLSAELVNHSRNAHSEAMRIPAQEIEQLVINQICNWLRDANQIIDALNLKADKVQQVLTRTNQLATELQENKQNQYQLLRRIVERVVVADSGVEITVKSNYVINSETAPRHLTLQQQTIKLRVPVALKRCGYSIRMIIPGDQQQVNFKDPYLIAHIAKAYQWMNMLTSGKAISIKEIAQREDVDPSHVTRTINRAFLAPDIVRAILNGTQPSHLNLKFLKQFRTLPIDWQEQRQLLGITKS